MELQELINKWEKEIVNINSHIKSEVHTKSVTRMMEVQARTISSCLADLNKLNEKFSTARKE